MKVLMPAKDIPLDSIVSKRGGEKQYTIRDNVRIFGENISQKEIRADDGTRFLVSGTGDINVVSGVTELIWYVSVDELYQYLYQTLHVGTPQ